ncbi:MAG: HopJ type III effector protein [Pseudomonadales bacterium]|nr:HopJ type III effector protein [Pseudomonadales bacterium]
MSNSLQTLLVALKLVPDAVAFEQVQEVIDEHYHYTPARFTNGSGDDLVVNEAGTNEGSCRIFAFAKLHQLSNEQTLACFGHFFRHDVLENPDGDDHANIRTFMRHGLEQVQFDSTALTPR